MRSISWRPGHATAELLVAMIDRSREPGLLLVVFPGGVAGEPAPERLMDAWVRSRSVTAADVRGSIGGGALEVALGCDLVFVRRDASLGLPPVDRPLWPGAVQALARAGAGALARGLLEDGPVSAEEAVETGLAHAVVGADDELPLPKAASMAALTAARDLTRSRATGGAGRALELATFRLLFAAGDPEEGARAFLERRSPRFGGGRGAEHDDGGGSGR